MRKLLVTVMALLLGTAPYAMATNPEQQAIDQLNYCLGRAMDSAAATVCYEAYKGKSPQWQAKSEATIPKHPTAATLKEFVTSTAVEEFKYRVAVTMSYGDRLSNGGRIEDLLGFAINKAGGEMQVRLTNGFNLDCQMHLGQEGYPLSVHDCVDAMEAGMNAIKKVAADMRAHPRSVVPAPRCSEWSIPRCM
jgi:hypothetical protein